MPTITLSVPLGLKQEMDAFKEMNWSEVARSAIRQKIEDLKLFKEITAKSKLTEKDALALGRKVKKAMHERAKREHPELYVK